MIYHCNRCESTDHEMHELGPAKFMNICKGCGYRWVIVGRVREKWDTLWDVALLALILAIIFFSATMYFRGKQTPPPPNGWFGIEKTHGKGKG